MGATAPRVRFRLNDFQAAAAGVMTHSVEFGAVRVAAMGRSYP